MEATDLVVRTTGQTHKHTQRSYQFNDVAGIFQRVDGDLVRNVHTVYLIHFQNYIVLAENDERLQWLYF